MDPKLANFIQEMNFVVDGTDKNSSTLNGVSSAHEQVANNEPVPLTSAPLTPASLEQVTFWQQVSDGNNTYYWNPVTGEVSWLLPAGGVVQNQDGSGGGREGEEEVEDVDELMSNYPGLKRPLPVKPASSESEVFPEGEGTADTVASTPSKGLKRKSQDDGASSASVTPVSTPVSQAKKVRLKSPVITGDDVSASRKKEQARFVVSGMVDTFSRKLQFLHVSTETLNELQKIAIQFETRLADWKNEGLSTKYMLGRLKLMNKELTTYESSVLPEGWKCVWDSSSCRYQYQNMTTNESTWECPSDPHAMDEEEEEEEDMEPPIPGEGEEDGDGDDDAAVMVADQGELEEPLIAREEMEPTVREDTSKVVEEEQVGPVRGEPAGPVREEPVRGEPVGQVREEPVGQVREEPVGPVSGEQVRGEPVGPVKREPVGLVREEPVGPVSGEQVRATGELIQEEQTDTGPGSQTGIVFENQTGPGSGDQPSAGLEVSDGGVATGETEVEYFGPTAEFLGSTKKDDVSVIPPRYNRKALALQRNREERERLAELTKKARAISAHEVREKLRPKLTPWQQRVPSSSREPEPMLSPERNAKDLIVAEVKADSEGQEFILEFPPRDPAASKEEDSSVVHPAAVPTVPLPPPQVRGDDVHPWVESGGADASVQTGEGVDQMQVEESATDDNARDGGWEGDKEEVIPEKQIHRAQLRFKINSAKSKDEPSTKTTTAPPQMESSGGTADTKTDHTSSYKNATPQHSAEELKVSSPLYQHHPPMEESTGEIHHENVEEMSSLDLAGSGVGDVSTGVTMGGHSAAEGEVGVARVEPETGMPAEGEPGEILDDSVEVDDVLGEGAGVVREDPSDGEIVENDDVTGGNTDAGKGVAASEVEGHDAKKSDRAADLSSPPLADSKSRRNRRRSRSRSRDSKSRLKKKSSRRHRDSDSDDRYSDGGYKRSRRHSSSTRSSRKRRDRSRDRNRDDSDYSDDYSSRNRRRGGRDRSYTPDDDRSRGHSSRKSRRSQTSRYGSTRDRSRSKSRSFDSDRDKRRSGASSSSRHKKKDKKKRRKRSGSRNSGDDKPSKPAPNVLVGKVGKIGTVRPLGKEMKTDEAADAAKTPDPQEGVPPPPGTAIAPPMQVDPLQMSANYYQQPSTGQVPYYGSYSSYPYPYSGDVYGQQPPPPPPPPPQELAKKEWQWGETDPVEWAASKAASAAASDDAVQKEGEEEEGGTRVVGGVAQEGGVVEEKDGVSGVVAEGGVVSGGVVSEGVEEGGAGVKLSEENQGLSPIESPAKDSIKQGESDAIQHVEGGGEMDIAMTTDITTAGGPVTNEDLGGASSDIVIVTAAETYPDGPPAQDTSEVAAEEVVRTVSSDSLHPSEYVVQSCVVGESELQKDANHCEVAVDDVEISVEVSTVQPHGDLSMVEVSTLPPQQPPCGETGSLVTEVSAVTPEQPPREAPLPPQQPPTEAPLPPQQPLKEVSLSAALPQHQPLQDTEGAPPRQPCDEILMTEAIAGPPPPPPPPQQPHEETSSSMTVVTIMPPTPPQEPQEQATSSTEPSAPPPPLPPQEPTEESAAEEEMEIESGDNSPERAVKSVTRSATEVSASMEQATEAEPDASLNEAAKTDPAALHENTPSSTPAVATSGVVTMTTTATPPATSTYAATSPAYNYASAYNQQQQQQQAYNYAYAQNYNTYAQAYMQQQAQVAAASYSAYGMQPNQYYQNMYGTTAAGAAAGAGGYGGNYASPYYGTYTTTGASAYPQASSNVPLLPQPPSDPQSGVKNSFAPAAGKEKQAKSMMEQWNSFKEDKL